MGRGGRAGQGQAACWRGLAGLVCGAVVVQGGLGGCMGCVAVATLLCTCGVVVAEPSTLS